MNKNDRDNDSDKTPIDGEHEKTQDGETPKSGTMKAPRTYKWRYTPWKMMEMHEQIAARMKHLCAAHRGEKDALDVLLEAVPNGEIRERILRFCADQKLDSSDPFFLLLAAVMDAASLQPLMIRAAEEATVEARWRAKADIRKAASAAIEEAIAEQADRLREQVGELRSQACAIARDTCRILGEIRSESLDTVNRTTSELECAIGRLTGRLTRISYRVGWARRWGFPLLISVLVGVAASTAGPFWNGYFSATADKARAWDQMEAGINTLPPESRKPIWNRVDKLRQRGSS